MHEMKLQISEEAREFEATDTCRRERGTVEEGTARAQDASDAEISKLKNVELAEENVIGLNIPMDYSFVVA